MDKPNTHSVGVAYGAGQPPTVSGMPQEKSISYSTDYTHSSRDCTCTRHSQTEAKSSFSQHSDHNMIETSTGMANHIKKATI